MMSEAQPQTLAAWGLLLEQALCEACDWRYLLPPGLLPILCPHCLQAHLVALAEDPHLPVFVPEQVIPFEVSPQVLQQSLEQFAAGIWFAPADLTAKNLKGRLQRVYLPMWLVDSQVQALWQAEVGFNYETVSHRDRFDENTGDWYSQQISETQVRWEPRVGRLNRSYHNIPAPALEEHAQLLARLGAYDLAACRPYSAKMLPETFIRLPNRSPADAWPETGPAFQVAAAGECQQASGAEHFRDFRWQAQYEGQHWTLLLLPLYTSYYLDDEGKSQPVLVHGQTGQLHGPRRASLKRAQRAILMLVGAAGIIFGLSLLAGVGGLLFPPLLVLAALGLVAALLVGLAAIVPPLVVWQTNRRQSV
jgi:hypothetical protein